jgi:hypothetical protein
MRLPHIANIVAVVVAVVVAALLGAGARAVLHDSDPVRPSAAIESNPPRDPTPVAAVALAPSAPVATTPPATPTSTTATSTVGAPPVLADAPVAHAPVSVEPTPPQRARAGVDHAADVADWIARFDAAHQARDLGFLLDTLHPTVSESYGTSVCEGYVESTMGSVHDVEVLRVGDPTPFEFPANSGQIRETVPVTARWTETPTGNSAVVDFHLVPTPSGYAWLTTCGTKLPTAT